LDFTDIRLGSLPKNGSGPGRFLITRRKTTCCPTGSDPFWGQADSRARIGVGRGRRESRSDWKASQFIGVGEPWAMDPWANRHP